MKEIIIMDGKRVAAVLFHFFINQGLGRDKHIIEYIMVKKKGEYTRRKYNITMRAWLYQLQWYRTIANLEFEQDTGFQCKWCFKNINIPTISHILEHKNEIPLEFMKVQ